MTFLLILVVCVLVAVATYGVLLQYGVIPGASEGRSAPRIPRPAEAPQGCLIAVIVAGALWFLFWAVILVVGLRFLRMPFAG